MSLFTKLDQIWEREKKENHFIRQNIESSFTPNAKTAADKIVTFLPGRIAIYFMPTRRLCRMPPILMLLNGLSFFLLFSHGTELQQTVRQELY